MSYAKIIFERDLENKVVNVKLDIGEGENRLPDDHIAVKWARKAMGYAHKIGQKMAFEFNPYAVDTGAAIGISGFLPDEGDLEDAFYELEEQTGLDREILTSGEFGIDPDWLDANPDYENAIGFVFDDQGAQDKIGGLASPTMQLAGLVYNILLRARERAKNAEQDNVTPAAEPKSDAA